MASNAVALVEEQAPAREERRRTIRRPGAVAVAVEAAGRRSVAGETVNVSLGGVLLRTGQRIPVIVTLNGKRYEGRIVRASSVDEDETEYAIELERLLQIGPSPEP